VSPLPTSERPDVASTRLKRAARRRFVQLVVMAENGNIRRLVHDQASKRLVGPGDDDLVCTREALAVGEARPGINNRHAKAEFLGIVGQRNRDMVASEED